MIAFRSAPHRPAAAWICLLAAMAGSAAAVALAQEAPGSGEEREGLQSPGSQPGAPAPGTLSGRFRPAYEGRIFRLRADLHLPQRGGHMAPWLDARGWHAQDVTRPILLGEGERVQITGLFDYADRSLFVEITRWPAEVWGDEPVRARVRITAAAPPEKPGAQDAEIRSLLATLLAVSPES